MPIRIVKSNKNPNWGDAFGPILVEKLSSQEVVAYIGKHKPKAGKTYLVCGSNLMRACPQTEVWGAGFLTSELRIDGKPKKIHCVRGRLTAKSLEKLEVPCPAEYGDPGLLCAKYFPPRTSKKRFKLGVIDHYRARTKTTIDGIEPIDITAGIQEVIDKVNECDHIVSSSLHGLVIADAVGVPAAWIKSYPRWEPHDFKFRDYFSTVCRMEIAPLDMTHTSIEKACEVARIEWNCVDVSHAIQSLERTMPKW